MPNENSTAEAEEAAEKINKEAGNQIMSNSVMALRQSIEDRLGKDKYINSVFKKKVRELFKEDIKPDSFPKVYVHIDYEKPDNDKSARIFSRIDRVENAVDKNVSYALHLRIISRGKNFNFPSYESKGFISRNCGRFAVGHDICHAVINLDDLINAATIKEEESKVEGLTNKQKELKADFFSYIQSDLRDFDLLEFDGKVLDLNKAFEDYQSEIKKEIDEKLTEEEKNERGEVLEEIRKIFDESEKLYKCSKRYTMSYSIFTLKKIINESHNSEYEGLNKKDKELNVEHENLNKKLGELTKEYDKWFKENEEEAKDAKVSGYSNGDKIKRNNRKMQKIRQKINETKAEIEKIKVEKRIIDKKINKLNEDNPKVNIHLVSRENYGESTIECYNRIDDGGKNFYCFEINIKNYSKEEKECVNKEVCKAIGCIYFGYKEKTIKKIVDKGSLGIPTMLQQLELEESKIDKFAEKLHDLRDGFIKGRRKRLMEEKPNEYPQLMDRLVRYSA
jgi:hypothetical protein